MLSGNHPFPKLSQMQAIFKVCPCPIVVGRRINRIGMLDWFLYLARCSRGYLTRGDRLFETDFFGVCRSLSDLVFELIFENSNHLERPSATDLLKSDFIRGPTEDPINTPTTSTFAGRAPMFMAAV